jgi:hypothetical protein
MDKSLINALRGRKFLSQAIAALQLAPAYRGGGYDPQIGFARYARGRLVLVGATVAGRPATPPLRVARAQSVVAVRVP